MARFRDLRVKSGYSQEEFRKLYNEKYNRNYTSAAISMIEHGKRMPELGALMDFADFYGVSLDYLLGRTGELDNGQISSQLNCIVENLDNHQESVNNAIENRAELKENLRMLKCLLEQSAVLARRMEKEDNSWYRF
ncbi:helix-turn-helix transcriptional regulator [Veillonellaceae bacterium WCA-693-APC-5D-A]|uniref:Helix-turn-helix transcriptional regulator n=1 Tax=Anaerovibrio slackiae TaxID=2652309 RepID=A0A6I2UC89_9FIRM|nr:helix-turn-helix transcriptional regulator [Anaerovibrio slackiae]MSU09143.1 helix-turn-helix transcriptional regulator [Anaerovibrio slackiae]